eukprot:1158946-Pelagomonas_calceolata.AAC.2
MGLMGLVYRGMSVSRCDAVAEGLKSNHRPSPRSPNSNALRAILLPYANAYILVQLDWTRAADGQEGVEAGGQQQEQQQQGQQGSGGVVVADGSNGEGNAAGGEHREGGKVEEGGGEQSGARQGGEGPSEMEGVEAREGA